MRIKFLLAGAILLGLSTATAVADDSTTAPAAATPPTTSSVPYSGGYFDCFIEGAPMGTTAHCDINTKSNHVTETCDVSIPGSSVSYHLVCEVTENPIKK